MTEIGVTSTPRCRRLLAVHHSVPTWWSVHRSPTSRDDRGEEGDGGRAGVRKLKHVTCLSCCRSALSCFLYTCCAWKKNAQRTMFHGRVLIALQLACRNHACQTMKFCPSYTWLDFMNPVFLRNSSMSWTLALFTALVALDYSSFHPIRTIKTL